MKELTSRAEPVKKRGNRVSKKIEELRFAELLEDFEIYGAKPIPQGTQLEVARSNSRYVYLRWEKCLLRVTHKMIKPIRRKR